MASRFGGQSMQMQREEKQSSRRPPSTPYACLIGRPRGGTNKGKQRIEMRRIEDKGKQQVTSSKRRRGLFKKASELSRLSGASVAVVAFSRAGNVFAFGAPSVDAVLRRHVAWPSTSTAHADAGDVFADDGPEVLDALKRAADETTAEVAAVEARLRAVAGKIRQAMAAGRRFWWEADVEALGEAELPEFVRALKKLRGAIVRRRSDGMLTATPTPTPTPRRRSS